jgi:ribosomal protein S18 acetylase RimI-like enzyme
MNQPHTFTSPEKNVWLLALPVAPNAHAQCACSVVEGVCVVVHSLKVPPQHRQQGHGREVLKRIIIEIMARWPKVPVYIHVLPYGEYSMQRGSMFSFYYSIGFRQTVETVPHIHREYRQRAHPYEMRLKEDWK